MLLSIILAVSFIPIWPVMYFITRNHVKPKKNIILGVTLPHDAHQDPETQSICRSFIKWLNILMLPMLPLILPPFLMNTSGAAMTWLMTWLLILIVAPQTAFALYRGKLMALKRTRNWNSVTPSGVSADIKAADISVKKLSGLWFIPPVIISLLPVAQSLSASADVGELLIYATFSGITLVFWLFYHLIYRVRADVVNEDMTLTTALTLVRRYNWNKFWLLSSWLTGVLNVLLWLFSGDVLAFLILTLGYTLLLLIIAMQAEFAARAAQQKLTEHSGGQHFLDEDAYWLLGMFYCNPRDKHFLVNDRVGLNMSVNLAKPGAKVLMAVALLSILALPFFGIWMWAEETTPTALILEDTTLTARHTGDQYVIALSDITSVSLLETLPSMTRTVGSGFENLYKGRFHVRDYGNSRICLQPKNPPFLVVKTDDAIYLLNDADSVVTRAVYEKIAD